MSSSEAKLIYQKYDEMMELLRGYREKIYRQWVAGVDQDCHFNLGQPLIQRDPVTNLIQVNFSKAVGAGRPHGAWKASLSKGSSGTRAPRQVAGGRSPKPARATEAGPLLPKHRLVGAGVCDIFS